MDPRLAVATWVGNADNAPMLGTTGLTGAAPVWHQVMQRSLGTQPDGWPPPPVGVDVVGKDHFLEGTGPASRAVGGASMQV